MKQVEVTNGSAHAIMSFDVEKGSQLGEITANLSREIDKKVVALDEAGISEEIFPYPGTYPIAGLETEYVFLLIENGSHEDVRLAIDAYTREANASNFYFETTD